MEHIENLTRITMRTFYVEVDTNDGDLIGYLVNVSDEDVERWSPLIEKIRAFEPYRVNHFGVTRVHRHNFPLHECRRAEWGEKDPCEMYNITDEELEDFLFAFRIRGGENGFHTITQIVEVKMLNRLV